MSRIQHCTLALWCAFSVFLITVSGSYHSSRYASWRKARMSPSESFSVASLKATRNQSGHTVELRLIGDPLPQVHRLTDLNSGAVEEPVSSDGVVRFFSEDSQVMIMLLQPRGYHTLHLRLNGAVEQDGPSVTLYISKDALAYRDEDEDFQVNLAVDNQPPSYHRILGWATSVKSFRTNDVVTYMGDAGLIEALEHDEYFADETWLLRLKPDRFQPLGVLGVDAEVGFDCDGTQCILHKYEIHSEVPILYYHGSGSAGPFPRHGIFFERVGRAQRSAADQQCSARGDVSPCKIVCSVVGDRPSAVEIVRVDDATDQLNPVSRVSLANGGFWALGQVVLGNLTPGASAVYRCSSRSGPNEINRTITVTVVDD